jgi:hypothetical protein
MLLAPDLEDLATCNLKDLTLPNILDAARKVNHAQGVFKEVRTGPPEAFLPSAHRRRGHAGPHPPGPP